MSKLFVLHLFELLLRSRSQDVGGMISALEMIPVHGLLVDMSLELVDVD